MADSCRILFCRKAIITILLTAISSVTVRATNGCGGDFVGSGNFTSPNFPSRYPGLHRCTWTLTAIAGQNILLRLLYLDLVEYNDYIYVYEEVKQESSLPPADYIANYTGQYNDSRLYIGNSKPLLVGPTATVMFFSNSPNGASGFQMEYTSINSSFFTGCGGHLAGSGYIASPNYPNAYPINCRCSWTIAASPGNFILLQIRYLRLEPEHDVITLFNFTVTSTSELSNYTRKISGDDDYRRIEQIVMGHTATVMFRSDISLSSSGFLVEYLSTNDTQSSGCGGNLVGSGFFTSPNGPNVNHLYSICTWTLTANPGEQIFFRFLIFGQYLEGQYVYVYEGIKRPRFNIYPPNDYIQLVRGHYETNLKPLLLGPTATVIYLLTDDVSNGIHQMEYKSVNVTFFSGCGGNLVGSGIITSPNYPDLYPMNSRCSWNITASADEYIILWIRHLDLEDELDYISFFNFTVTPSTQLSSYTRKYSGSGNNTYYNHFKPVLMGSAVTVTFRSDISIARSGFSVEYATVNAQLVFSEYTGCGGHLAKSGSILSPNYPNVYPMNCRCTWTISASDSKFILLQIKDLNLENIYDFVTIFNFTVASTLDLSKYTNKLTGDYGYGNTVSITTGPTATVRFSSDISISQRGFKIQFTSITHNIGCGGNLFGSGVFSLGYENTNPRYKQCFWTFTASAGQSLLLRLLNLDFRSPTDYIYVYDEIIQESSFPNLGYIRSFTAIYDDRRYYMSNSKPFLVGPTATVIYYSFDPYGTSRFQMEYKSVDTTVFTGCGGQLDGSGNITSPNYPDHYPANSRCFWTITANAGSSIVLRIRHLDLEDSIDYLTIFNFTVTSYSDQSDLSNHTLQYSGGYNSTYYNSEPIVIGPTATVMFSSSFSSSTSGFQLEYTSVSVTQPTEYTTTVTPPEKPRRCKKIRRDDTSPTFP